MIKFAKHLLSFYNENALIRKLLLKIYIHTYIHKKHTYYKDIYINFMRKH